MIESMLDGRVRFHGFKPRTWNTIVNVSIWLATFTDVYVQKRQDISFDQRWQWELQEFCVVTTPLAVPPAAVLPLRRLQEVLSQLCDG